VLSKEQATAIIKAQFPERTITFVKTQDALFLFRAIEPEESDESGFDDLFSVDNRTSQVKEFSIFDVKE
jgi:phosphoketolase